MLFGVEIPLSAVLIFLVVSVGLVILLSLESAGDEGAKKDAEVPLVYSPDENDVRSLFALLGTIAAADGNVSDIERREVQRFTAAHINPKQHELAKSSFEIGIKEQVNRNLVKSHAFELYWDVEKRWLDPLQILEILIRVAVVDKEIDALKEYAIDTVASTLGVHERTYKILRDTIRQKYGFAAKYTKFAKAKSPWRKRDSSERGASPDYEILGVPQDASLKEIQKAYRVLVKQYHPDKLQDEKLSDDQREAMLRKFCEIQEAYETLCAEKG